MAVAGLAAFAVAGTGAAFGSTAVFGHQQVGTEYKDGIQVASDQIVKPIGDRLLSRLGAKMLGSTVSPDGRYLAATSTLSGISVQIIDLQSYKIIWTVGTGSGVNQKISDSTIGQGDPTYSPDGKSLWISNQNGLSRYPVNADGTLGSPTVISLPTTSLTDKAGKTTTVSALPSEVAYSADGSTLYVALNGQNKIVAMNPQTGAVTQTWSVGIAPREIVVVGSKLYVSNEGGRTATANDTTINSYGTDVPSDPVNGTSTTGTVSVINTATPAQPVKSIAVGLHPTSLYRSGNALFVANTNSDSVSVIDTGRDQVVQTINTQPWSGSEEGYQPNGITMINGRLLVTLGRANAVAVYKYDRNPRTPLSYVGLLPTDYYPTTIATDGDKVIVTNERGIGDRGPQEQAAQAQTVHKPASNEDTATGWNTLHATSSLTRFALPDDQDIAKYTNTVFHQNGWTNNDVSEAKRGVTAKPVPVPTRIGDPSPIKYVFLIVKENRTYDQQFGDLPQGNGDPALTQFGKTITPNQHALAEQFGLYDNFYDVPTQSSDGHAWMMMGDDPEYTESSAGEFIRSYDSEDDVLGHQRAGFIWTAAEQAGKSVRDFSEFMIFNNAPAGATWQKYYCPAKSAMDGGDPAQLTDPSIKNNVQSPIPSLNAIANHEFPWADRNVPDIYREQIWQQDFEKNGPANLNIMSLPDDHTGGPPSPEAQVADNDLAVGKIIDTISHSKYWKNSAIFIAEDDTSSGVDHVDGHRAPIQVISPYAIHGKVNSTYYSQITMVRTIEQILGAQPLNQRVAAATPMYGAFQSKPDYTPFNALPNQIPLTEGLDTPPACGNDTLGKTGAAAQAVNAEAAAATKVPAGEQKVAALWAEWATHQRFTGKNATVDYSNPEQMNRYTWYRTYDWSKPYPGDPKIYAPSQVPGAAIPNPDSDQ